ncbi:MAG: NAD(P)/FAD-dependent oxidoreductase [Candidatus Bathyarchaeia archaeon]
MKNDLDVIVVGGGPCGSFAAFHLAKNGVNVKVFEEHSEIGVPCHCTGHVSIKSLKNLGLHPLPKGIIQNTFKGIKIHSPTRKEFAIRFSNPLTCVLNRTLFDKHIAKKAEEAGAHYYLSVHVESLIIEDNYVKGVIVKHKDGTKREIFSEIVIDAGGVHSKILRIVGLRTVQKNMVVNGVQAEVENIKDVERDTVEVFLGRDFAPGFYAWIVPLQEDKAKVGLATKTGNPKEHLQKFMFKHPTASKKLQNAKILHITFHPIPLGGPIPKAYSNGFLAVGDAASHVKPTTGGGLIFGMTCAGIAAKIAKEALDKGDFSAEFLGAYQKLCEKFFGFDMDVMLRLRRILNAMPDKNIDNTIEVYGRFGLEKIFGNVREIDFQGRSLLNLLWKPRMLSAMLLVFPSLPLRECLKSSSTE